MRNLMDKLLRNEPDEDEEPEEVEESPESEEEPEEEPPEIKEHTRRKKLQVYETTLYYDNGDRETIETYGEQSRSEEGIKLITDVSVSPIHDYGHIHMDTSKNTKFYSFQYMSREPIMNEKCIEIHEYSYKTEDGSAVYGSGKETSFRNIGDIDA